MAIDEKPKRRSSSTKAIAAVVAVFVSGLVLGAVIAGSYVKYQWDTLLGTNKTVLIGLFRSELQREVGFNEQQLDQIVELSRPVWVQTYLQVVTFKPQVDQAFVEYISNVKQLSTDEQRKRFDRYINQRLGTFAPHHQRELYRRLQVSPEQMLEIDKLLADEAKSLTTLPGTVDDLAVLLIRSVKDEIRKLLREEQHSEFDRIYAELPAQ